MEVQIALSHEEFAILKDFVEDGAERNHEMVFKHPELLSGFREATQELIHLWQEGVFDQYE